MEFFVHISLAFSLLVSFVAAYPGHSPRHDANHLHQARQDGGAPFAGIEVLTTTSVISLTTVTTRRPQLTASCSSSRPTGPTTYITAGTRSFGPIPITIIPVPVATICSRDARQTSATLNVPSVTSPILLHLNSEAKLPAAATAILELNSSSVNERPAPVPTFTAFDGSGCSTLYTRKSSAICSTALSGLGSLPISVTDCGQSVTFSTSTGAQRVPTTAISSDPVEQGKPFGERLAYFVAPWYDIAHGQVPERVLVENCVRVVGGEACGKVTESWRVVNQTTSINVTQSIAFEGPVTGVSFLIWLSCKEKLTDMVDVKPAVLTLGKGLWTTNVPASTTTMISIQSNVTTAIATTVPSLSRSVIRASMAPSSTSSPVASGPLTTTSTVVLEAVSHTTVTVFRTLTSTVTHAMTTEWNTVANGGS